MIEKSEHLLVLVSHDQKESSAFKKFIAKVKGSGKPYSFLFTKADLEQSEFVAKLKTECEESHRFSGAMTIKNKTRDSVKGLLKQIAESLPKEDFPLYDPDMISLDRTRDIVSEFIREQCFLQLDKEIPFGLGVVIKSFKREKGLRHIQANILIEKENHKAILIGKGGQKLKTIGQEARKKIEELLGEKVFLGLHVAFKKNWMKNKNIMKEVGYHHDKR